MSDCWKFAKKHVEQVDVGDGSEKEVLRTSEGSYNVKMKQGKRNLFQVFRKRRNLRWEEETRCSDTMIENSRSMRET